ncbi:ricin-type beta-trefoil lectin domain protein [Micromonospora sp. RB23]
MRRARALTIVIGTLALAVAGSVPAQAVGGGQAVTDNSYPFIAKVDFGVGVRSCTGTLLDPHWVITAATCLSDTAQRPAAGPPAQATTVTVGRVDMTSTAGQVRTAVSVVPHPTDNLALLRLDQPVTTHAPARIGSAPTIDEQLQALGYGRTASQWVPDQLHGGTFTVTSVGAGSVDLDGAATGATLCRGDAGGPSVRRVGSSVEVVAVHDRSLQGGCFGETETRRTAVDSRLDNQAGWVRGSIDAAPDWSEGLALPITNGFSGNCLVTAASTNQSPVATTTCSASAPEQQWTMVPNGSGTFHLRNAKTGKCLYGETPRLGDVKIYTCDTGITQQWQITTGSLRSQLKNAGSGLCIASPSATPTDVRMDTCGTFEDHYWVQRGNGGGAYGPLQAEALGLCLVNYDGPGVHSSVPLGACGSSDRAWTQSGTTLRGATGCLTAGTPSTDPRRITPVSIGTCTGAKNQDWIALPNGTFKNPGSGNCLATAFDRVETPAYVGTMAPCSGQSWRLPDV